MAGLPLIEDVRWSLDCRIIVLVSTRLVVSGLENLGVDCLLGNDVVNHMGSVLEKGSPTPGIWLSGGTTPVWLLPSIPEEGGTTCVLSLKLVLVFPRGCPQPLDIFDKDFIMATFANGQWTVMVTGIYVNCTRISFTHTCCWLKIAMV